MSGAAKVTSIDTVRDFKAALLKFRAEALSALEVMRMELNRSIDWIEHDRPAYWAVQVRRAFDLVASTRTALNTCQLRSVAGRRPSCIEEKQAHAKARQRLQFCQEQVGRVKRWAIKIRHEGDEFRGRVANLQRCLESHIPQTLALLERTATILEQYAEVPRPGDGTEDELPPAVAPAEQP